MEKPAQLIVLCGLPAAGKSTVLKLLAERGFVTVPEFTEWRGARLRLPGPPTSREEKLAKQRLLMEIEQERTVFAREHLRRGATVAMDTDFTAMLAYNSADRRRAEHFDIYTDLVGLHREALHAGTLMAPDAYLFLDVPLAQRRARRDADPERRRNEVFFNETFGEDMHAYFVRLRQAVNHHRAATYMWLMEPSVEDACRACAVFARFDQRGSAAALSRAIGSIC